MGGSCVLAPPSGLAFPCDTYAQDCPRGEKCNPFACGSDLWNATVCVPIAREPAQIGEPCQVEGPTSPFDDCDIGLMCMFVDDAGEGECVGMCQGNAFSPVCDEGTCYLGFHGVVQVCLQPCDPLGDACSAGACVPNPYGGFVCFPSVAPVGLGDACEHDAQCPPSAVCRGRAPTCVTVCDLQAPAPVSGCAPDEACSPWPGPKRLPPEHADVGVCTPA
jgi:hypothetical protein